MGNRKSKLVGLTGGIGSGKSHIARFFSLLGIPIYFADKEAKRLVTEDPALKKAIIELLGEDAYFTSGEYNRAFVAKKVFQDQPLLAKLNGLIHPAVRKDFIRWSEDQDAPYCLEEAALLVETGGHTYFDELIAISCPAEIRISRVLERDPHRGRGQIESIVNQQATEEERAAVASFIIDNSGKSLVIPQCLNVHERLIAG